MKTLFLKSQFYYPNLTNPHTNPSFFIPTRITCKHGKHPSKTETLPAKIPSFAEKSLNLSEVTRHSKNPSSPNEEILNGYSRNLLLGAVSVGFVLLVMGIDEQSRALALGPEGPLMEEFWDNMRRYGLYVLTSAGMVTSQAVGIGVENLMTRRIFTKGGRDIFLTREIEFWNRKKGTFIQKKDGIRGIHYY